MNRKSHCTCLQAVLCLSLVSAYVADSCAQSDLWTSDFHLDSCTFVSTGRNSYFILEPGYQLRLTGTEDADTIELVITVLNETERIGSVETRVVEERESENGELIEVSRNLYAICTQTNSVFYFGEDVDVYEDGRLIGHSGAWRAGETGARAGVMMPGLILYGARYYQEIAPDAAMDRAEVVSDAETVRTPAGTFHNCLKTRETTPLEADAVEHKYYAPGIGLIRDGNLYLSEYGGAKNR